MTARSGDQYEFTGDGYRAVVTEGGATLRLLEYDRLPLLDGFGPDEASYGGRGQVLAPWPNRVRDGRYTFDGKEHQLPLTEVGRGNAHHGLVRWVSWTVEEHTAHSVSLVYRLMAQPGYPWTVDLHLLYDLSADGLTVTATATNLSDSPAPWAYGAHPYLSPGTPVLGALDGWELTLPAATRLLVDDRLVPVGSADVTGTEYDFRTARAVRGLSLDDPFTDLDRDADGRASVTVRDPATEEGAVLWLDSSFAVVQLFTADEGREPRRSLAVEPMTAPPNALASGEHLVRLAPAGSSDAEWSACWGLRHLG